MRSIVLLAMTLLMSVLPASAQFTLTESSFPATGSHTVGEALGTVTFNVGSSGANQTWNFSNYTWEYVYREELVDPAASPYIAHFPTANRCVHMSGGGYPVDFYVYYRKASNGMYFLGTGSIDTVAVPVSEARVIPFPCTYQTSWTTVIRYDYQPVPGLHVTHTDSSVNTMDGYGTLITPYTNTAVLRWFSHTWVTTRIPPMPPQTTESVSYSWLSSQGEELLVVTSEEGVTNPNFSQGYLEMTGVPLAVEPVRGPVARGFSVGQNYPNPFNPETRLPLELATPGQVTVTIYDETGRVVSEQEFDLAAGQHDVPVSGHSWAAGTYFARVQAAAQAQTVKMQLIK